MLSPYLQPDAALTVIWLMDNSEKEVIKLKTQIIKKRPPGKRTLYYEVFTLIGFFGACKITGKIKMQILIIHFCNIGDGIISIRCLCSFFNFVMWVF